MRNTYFKLLTFSLMVACSSLRGGIQNAGAQELASLKTVKTAPNTAVTNDSSDMTAGARPSVRIGRATAPPKIDGVMSEGEWDGASKFELTFQIYPEADDTRASEATHAFVLYNREHLYIAFHAFDSTPTAIRAPLSKRDNIDADDYVSIFLDTYHDKERAYYLSVSAAGVQQDGIYTEAAGSDAKWDGIFESQARRTSEGYIVEMAIPFKTLRFKAGKNATWGLLLRRWIPRKSERVSWTRFSRDQNSRLAQAGTLNGLDEIYSGRSIDVIPTVTASQTSTREADVSAPDGARLSTVNRIDPGLTVIYSVAPNATISASINPDFSQVEADVPQISINQRFPLSFPEKRPFFLEGSEFFNATAPGGGMLTICV
jgi:hypothetical protein